jgi:Protein of unknown function (DUF1569)
MNTLGAPEGHQEIVNRIARLSPRDKPLWGRMSVHQMICHLNDSYQVGLGEKFASPAGGPLTRTLIKWIALWAPLKWMKEYPTRPEVEQGKGGTVPVDFETDRKALLAVVERFSKDLPRQWSPHPVFGPMNAREWRRWGYLHADHHLRQFGR